MNFFINIIFIILVLIYIILKAKENNFIINKTDLIMLAIPLTYSFSSVKFMFYLLLIVITVLILAPLPELQSIKIPYLSEQNKNRQVKNVNKKIVQNEEFQVDDTMETTLVLDEDINFS